jgi:hypothetical protein
VLPIIILGIILGAVLIYLASYLLSGTPIAPASPFQNFRNPIHDARPVVSSQPAPQPHRDR